MAGGHAVADDGRLPSADSTRLECYADAGCLARARRWVTGFAEEHGAGRGTCQVLALLTTELLTNAVLHGDPEGEVLLEASHHDGSFRVSVFDAGDRGPVVRRPGPRATSGRGVMLVATLAKEWGVLPDPVRGKTVWFTVVDGEGPLGGARWALVD
jgi:serine/threonine-protein kinase RsbW